MNESEQFSPDELIARSFWLIQHPQFEEKPATIDEFLGPDYLNIASSIRPGVRQALIDIFGDETSGDVISDYQKAIVTGAIGIGKSTIASIALPFMVHWVLCLRDPQEFFALIPGSRIAFMMMSTSEKQAREVLFGDVFARIKHSKWFKNHPFDPGFTRQIKFDKDINILPGDSKETTFEGYNILGGVIDEIDSHTVTKEKDYADVGYDCVDEKTTILTKEGWRKYSDLSIGDEVLTLNHETGQSEWNEVEAVKIFPDGIKDMIAFESDRFSAFTTANHRWPVIDNKQNRIWRTSETLSTGHAIIKAAPNANLPTQAKYDDAFVELVAWTYTEGHFRSENCLDIYQNFGHTADRISACIQKLGGSGNQNYNGERNCARISLNNSELSRSVREVMRDKAPTPEWLLTLTAAQLELFIQISLIADNCGSDKFAQVNPFAAEAFAFACILAGYPVSIKQHHDKKRNYSTTLARKLRQWQVKPINANRYSSNMKIEQKQYDGVVWCPRTKNKSWFARREGSTYFTGNTIENRMTSRFGKRGLVICIGQMKKATGFAARKFAEFSIDPDAYANRMAIWESLGWNWKGDPTTKPYPFLEEDGSHDSFYYDHKRRAIIPKRVGQLLPDSDSIIEIPNYYRRAFERAPEKALKDLAGIPPKVSDPFISLVDRIEFCRELWIARYFPEVEDYTGDLSEFSPITQSSTRPEFKKWFTNKVTHDLRRRAIHVDIGYSGEGDALGLAMGHIAGLKDDGDGEEQPIICFDFLMRIKAPAGNEIFLPDVRKLIYYIRDELGFRIQKVTYDGFESQEAVQQLRRRRFDVDKVSVDKSTLPYEDLRDAIYGGRCEFPPYVTEWQKGDADSYVEIAVKELSELQHDGRKVDHPPTGSKDLTDAMAGVVHELIGDRRYRRGVHSILSQNDDDKPKGDWTKIFDKAANPLPLPDNMFSQSRMPQGMPGIDMGIIVPDHLKPRNR